MSKRLHLINRAFGWWAVLDDGISVRLRDGKVFRYFLCRCKCGTIRRVKGTTLVNGSSISCGCYAIKTYTIHGASSLKNRTQKQKCIYDSWHSMCQRCFNPKATGFKYYGGASEPVQVCAQWTFFHLFWRDVEASWFPGASIDRYPDNRGHYHRLNYRWATREEQAKNSRNTKLTQEAADWIRFCSTRWGWPPRLLSECNSVSLSTLSSVLSEKTWKPLVTAKRQKDQSNTKLVE